MGWGLRIGLRVPRRSWHGPERARRAPQPRTTPSSPGAKGFPEPWGSVMAAMVGGRGTISTCCDPRAGEEAGPSTDDSAEVSTNHGA